MKWMQFASLAALVTVLSAGSAFAGADEVYRQQSDATKMMHKLGRGVTNVLTCWVEWPRNVAIEWEKTDPATGLILGTVKGFGWGFARFATGIYETFTFPFPVPEGYEPMLEPEFVVTDVWGDPIPGFDEAQSIKPENPMQGPVYPQRFSY
jgi:putative exosortase-associated protein (TIGR04073 family)